MTECDDLHRVSLNGQAVSPARLTLSRGSTADIIDVHHHSFLVVSPQAHVDLVYAERNSDVTVKGYIKQLFLWPGSSCTIGKEAYVCQLYVVQKASWEKGTTRHLQVHKEANVLERFTVTDEKAKQLIQQITDHEIEFGVEDEDE
jgi:hypothetical protein